MVNDPSASTHHEPLPLHELLSEILAPDGRSSPPRFGSLPALGTMQQLNERLASQPLLDFLNYNLRGIGQVIFVNNPISGAIVLAALFLQSPWVGVMAVLGVMASTLTAIALKLDRDTIRNGIFGYNGILVGAALATFGLPGNGAWNLSWAIAAIGFSALTTVLMKTLGTWVATHLKSLPLTLPFNIATLLFLGLAMWVPQSLFNLGTAAAPVDSAEVFDGVRLATALPIGFGQVFLADRLICGFLIVLAVAICTPIGAGVGLLGCLFGVLAGLVIGIAPDTLYAGLWGYNALLCAMAIGGVFYAPTLRSIAIGLFAAFLSALAGGALGLLFAPLGLPVLTLPFCVVTIAVFVVLQRSLPSLVPVALHALTSPEEHWQRYLAAKDIITNFRRQLEGAMEGQRCTYLFEKASSSMKGNLRYLFDAIDTDRSGTLSTAELAAHLSAAGRVSSEAELAYLFTCMDADGSGEIDFEEFGELMLRHQRLMAQYGKFVTYFLPIDANGDDIINIEEMNVAMASVGETALTTDETTFMQQTTGGQPLTWSRFIEVLLVT